MEKYNKIKLLGSGSFGSAWLVYKKDSKEECVIKEISITDMKVKDKDAAINEIKILSTLRHKNIVRYKEAFVHYKILCITMEYADDGDLYTKIKSQDGKLFLEIQIIDWFVQILIAVKYIHSLNILHRDLKSQNIFVTKEGIIKVGDFGISRYLHGTSDKAKTTIGTPYYLSPEICQQKPYNSKSDMWSLGVLLYEMTSLRHPFVADDISSLIVRIINGDFAPIPSCYGPLLQDIILILLQVEANQRPSASNLLKVPTLQPHIKSYLLKVKHKECPVIFDGRHDDEKFTNKKVGRRSLDCVGKEERKYSAVGGSKIKTRRSLDCHFPRTISASTISNIQDESDVFLPDSASTSQTSPKKHFRMKKSLSSNSVLANCKSSRTDDTVPKKVQTSPINFIQRNKQLLVSSIKKEKSLADNSQKTKSPEKQLKKSDTFVIQRSVLPQSLNETALGESPNSKVKGIEENMISGKRIGKSRLSPKHEIPEKKTFARSPFTEITENKNAICENTVPQSNYYRKSNDINQSNTTKSDNKENQSPLIHFRRKIKVSNVQIDERLNDSGSTSRSPMTKSPMTKSPMTKSPMTRSPLLSLKTAFSDKLKSNNRKKLTSKRFLQNQFAGKDSVCSPEKQRKEDAASISRQRGTSSVSCSTRLPEHVKRKIVTRLRAASENSNVQYIVKNNVVDDCKESNPPNHVVRDGKNDDVIYMKNVNKNHSSTFTKLHPSLNTKLRPSSTYTLIPTAQENQYNIKKELNDQLGGECFDKVEKLVRSLEISVKDLSAVKEIWENVIETINNVEDEKHVMSMVFDYIKNTRM